jgi:hypothetical protein
MSKITVTIQISKARVLDEVAKTTEYIGSKAVNKEDPDAYERIAVTDANREQLDRYWMESCSEVTKMLDHWVTSVRSQMLSHHPEISSAYDYKVVLGLPTNWNSAYESVLKELVMSYMVNMIVAKWLLLTNKNDAQEHATLASGAQRQIMQVLLIRKRPAPRKTGVVDDGLWHRADVWHRDEPW